MTEIAPIAVKAYVFGSTRLVTNTGKRFSEGPSMVTGSAENSAAMLAGQIALLPEPLTNAWLLTASSSGVVTPLAATGNVSEIFFAS